MKRNLSKLDNESLLIELYNNMDYVTNGYFDAGKARYHEKLYAEVLRRMSCYNFVVKPPNKKLYTKDLSKRTKIK